MKTVIAAIGMLFAVIGSSSASASDSSVVIRHRPARVLGLWSFVQSASDCGWRPSAEIRRVFESSRFADAPGISEKLTRFCEIHKAHMKQGYAFEGFPRQRTEMGWDVDTHFMYQASQSQSLNELRSRTVQVLPGAVHTELFSILMAFEPVYDELIWSPSLSRLENYSKRLESAWNQGKLSEAFGKAIRFYRSSWSDSPEFTVHLVPVPSKNAHTFATVIQDSILVEALLDESDIAGRAGVIFHELSHSAYENQSSSMQIQLEGWILSSSSKYKGLAYGLLNEGLATALGNGWAYSLMTGSLDSKDWYSVDEINRGAKAALPLIREYLDSGKSMDEDFVRSWISVYERTFPDAFTRPDILTKRSVLLVEGKGLEISDIASELRWVFRVNSLHSSYSLANSASLDTLQTSSPSAALLIVLTPGHRASLRRLSRTVPELSRGILALQKAGKRNAGVFYSQSGRAFGILQVSGQEDLMKAVKALSMVKSVPEEPLAFHF